MPITDKQVEIAQAKQHRAAHDASPQVRLIAGPGTGKSFAIGERIHWLLSNGVSSDTIYAVSFTRAASRDLKRRIEKYCKGRGHTNVERVSVSTLHSLALKVLSLSNLLDTEPVVLDQWELSEIFDAELAEVFDYKPKRCKEIREYYEASLAANIEDLAGHRLPTPPTNEENSNFLNFLQSRRDVYHCVLPGEIVRQCVNEWKVGTVDPVEVLKASNLIVDEYQDLNETDQEFVQIFIENGVTTFIAGDDDQSIYAFRYASPAGIQNFTSDYPNSGDHELDDCFRCTVEVLASTRTLITKYGAPTRIKKSTKSLYEKSNPTNPGVVHRWKFSDANVEARAIASSCRALIDASDGTVKPRDILVLIGNQKLLLPPLKNAFEKEGVEYEPPHEAGFTDSKIGRFVYSLLRIVCSESDYVARRVLFGQLPGVGITTCNNLVDGVLESRHNYRDIFHDFWLPQGKKYEKQTLNLLDKARDICSKVADWNPEDTLTQRLEEMADIVSENFGDAKPFIEATEHLPKEMNLEELRSYLSADTDKQQERLLESVYERLGIELPEDGLLPQRVRMMTMHGSKGLDAPIVFIPGLEEGVLPRDKQKNYPAELSEAARMLYVAITRAKAAGIISYSENRVVHGDRQGRTRSRFIPELGGQFLYRDKELSDVEIFEIVNSIKLL